jgi:hypothetical protein
MAGSISHTVYAEKALKTVLKGKLEKQFIIGNLFPDIRYLKVIDRESTHFTNVTLKDIQQESDSFKAGMLFHSLIDEAREAFVLSHQAYAGLPDSHLSTVALKICEDIQLYHKAKDWRTYIGYLHSIEPHEQKFNIPIEKLQEWHAMHIEFFTNPSLGENSKFFSALGFDHEQVLEINNLVGEITKSRVTDSYLNDFYNNLEQHLPA